MDNVFASGGKVLAVDLVHSEDEVRQLQSNCLKPSVNQVFQNVEAVNIHTHPGLVVECNSNQFQHGFAHREICEMPALLLDGG